MSKIRIFVAGHTGMVGSAIVRILKKKKNINLILKNHSSLDLTNQKDVKNFFKKEKPNQVYIAAAKVGGILANNNYPADFIYNNLMIQSNIIHSSFEQKVQKLLFLGSSCIYPKYSSQPISENSLLSGILEPTNEPYAIAKIAGIKMCESYNRQFGIKKGVDFRSVMPTNLYGPGDNYDLKNSHVIPALLRKFHEAKLRKQKKIYLWGTGKPRREFLHVDDLAIACVYIMNLSYSKFHKSISSKNSHINIGSNYDLTIKELAHMIKEIVGYEGEVKFDKKYPDGMTRKLLNSKLINELGWKPKIKLHDGLLETYKDFKKKVL